MKNYYEILEVSQNASPEVIEKAYRTLVKKYHPDSQLNKDSYFFENKIKDITEAYNVLSDKNAKTDYDLKLKLYNKDYYNSSSSSAKKNPENKKSIFSKIKTSDSNNKISIKKYISAIGQAIYDETKKDKLERNRDLVAILLTIIFVSMIVFIFWNVPFLKQFFSP
ncbi:MAG: hypothetical protein E7310_00200 [Clostridiales bacterium]|nr:hypothetical protein [Clostridiales bacterium]